MTYTTMGGPAPPPEFRYFFDEADALLLQGLQQSNVETIRSALGRGADPNRVSDRQGPVAPLKLALDANAPVRAEIFDLLFQAGANPNMAIGDRGRLFNVLLAQSLEDCVLSALRPAPVALDILTFHDRWGSSMAVAAVKADSSTRVLQAMQDLFERQHWIGEPTSSCDGVSDVPSGPGLSLDPSTKLPRNHLWSSRDSAGQTALMAAIHHRHSTSLRWLLEHPELDMKGALDVGNFQGLTALRSAVEIGCLESAAVLLSHGADVHAPCRELKTPLSIAQNLANVAPSRQPMFDLLSAHEAAKRARRSIDELLLSCETDHRMHHAPKHP